MIKKHFDTLKSDHFLKESPPLFKMGGTFAEFFMKIIPRKYKK